MSDTRPIRRFQPALLAMTALISACAAEPPAAPTARPPGGLSAREAPLLGDASDPYLLTAPATRTGIAATVNIPRYARLTVPANHEGLRIAVRAGQNVDVIVRRDGANGAALASGYDRKLHTFFFPADQTTADNNWWVELKADDTTTIDLQVEPTYARSLAWDDGTTLAGATASSLPANNFGDHLYRITARAPLYGAWRNVLQVTSGEADLYLQQGSFPPDWVSYRGELAGSDNVILAAPEFAENQIWYLRVAAKSSAPAWRLVSGDIHVVDFGALADATAARTLTMDVGGIAWFRTSATAQTLAWRLASNVAGTTFYVNDTTAPVPRYSSSTWDQQLTDEGLIVPDYLKSQGYIVTVTAPAASALIDSRNHRVIDPSTLPGGGAFAFTVNGTDEGGFGYATYKVEVPVQQIAWQVTATPLTGDIDLYVGKGRVPSDRQNDGFSEVKSVTDSVSFVPPTLTNGTFYVTVRGKAPFSFRLTSGNPTITPISFVDTVQNGQAFANQVGWRYFIVSDIASQVGALGWVLELANQVPGTEIAIRRNAVPGRWKFRTWNYGYEQETEHIDVKSNTGFLERPNHPADIWYVGIYQPTQTLGNFSLQTKVMEATTLAFNDGVSTVTGQTSGRWRYFKVTVPTDCKGWDLRVDGVSSGRPRMVVRAELVPQAYGDYPWWGFWSMTDWDSGWYLSPSGDLTKRNTRWVDQNTTIDETGRAMLVGMGAPLRAGVFYVGVSDLWTTPDGTPLTYTLRSRGIGEGASWSIPIQSLAFSGGTATATNLAPRDLRIYKTTVPEGASSFALDLVPSVGDAMMAIKRGGVPNHEAGASGADGVTGARRQKNGPEFFYRYPDGDAQTIQSGDYYIAVGAEGAATAQDGTIRGGTTSFTLTSRGEKPVTGPSALSTEAPLSYTNQTLRYGEQKAYRFTVPAGISSVEIRLTKRAGSPYFNVSRDRPFPAPNQSYYAAEGGNYSTISNDDIATMQAPSGTYTVLVTANSGPGEAAADYDLNIIARGESVLAFNGGSAPILDQESQTWRYFKVEVPAGALGWDLRLENVTRGRPRLVIRRDQLPENFSTNPWCCPSLPNFGDWQTGWTWAPGGELTQRNYAFYDQVTYQGGQDETGRRVSMGMDNPLKPGTYYVGVSDTWWSETGEPMNYELISRGIGSGNDATGKAWSIQVVDMDFDNGTLTRTLAPREHAYVRVQVPEGAKSWEVELQPTVGEAMFAVRKDALPNADAGTYNNTLETGAGTVRRKNGLDLLYRYPEYAQTAIPAGTYYLAVGAEGQNAYSSSYIGIGNSTFTLASRGELEVAEAPAPLADRLSWTGQTLRYGAQKAYRFTVPAGTKSMEVRLENRTGYPVLTIAKGEALPAPSQYYYAAIGGTSALTSTPELTTLTDPSGVYTVIVTANYQWPGGEVDATYDLVVEAIGETPLAFNGGEVSVTGHEPRTWRYFRVNVPTGALGWDLRLEEVTGRPRMVIRRDLLPDSLYTNPWCCPSLPGQGRWDTGWSWAVGADLTNRPYSFYDPVTYTGGFDQSGRRVSMGLGTPLEPGTYIVGVTDVNNPSESAMSYRLVSRGIGVGQDAQGTPWSIGVRDLPVGETVEVTDLAPREVTYFRVQLPSTTKSWGAELEPVIGEVMMALRKDGLPNAEAGGYASDDAYNRQGTRRQKNGREWFYKLPWYDQRDITGTYYIAVGAEGQNAYSTSYIGQGSSGFRLKVNGDVPVIGTTDTVVETGPYAFAGQRTAWGEHKYYRFRVPPTVPAFEVRLENRVGGPYFDATVEPYFDPKLPYGNNYSYASTEGGASPDAQSDVAETLVGLTGDVTVGVHSYGYDQAENAYDLVITPLTVKPLAWDGGEARVVLKDRETAFFRIEVPQDCDGVAQAGWIVSQELVRGQVSVDVRKDVLPRAPGSTYTLSTSARETVIVPPFLEPGTWYIAVRATGNSEAVIRTREVKEDRAWTMPLRGQNASTPGLTHPYFADTGVAPDGTPISNQGTGDSGADLGEGRYRFYRVTVPAGNGGLFRTKLEAISGDPELYIRRGAAPTLSYMPGSYYNYVDYSDTRDGSSYGHWVAVDTRYGTELPPGEYWIAVYAQGSNVRYRLTLDVGVVSDLAQSGGSVTGHALAAGDMRFYRVKVPALTTNGATSAPQDWTLNLTQQQGDATVFLREEVPPGLYSNVPDPSYGDSYVRDWNGDRAAYVYGLSQLPRLEDTGALTMSFPWLKADTTYWVGVYAKTDVVYDLASSVSASRRTIDGVLDWQTGRLDIALAAGGKRLYRIDVPATAGRYLHTSTAADGVKLAVSVGYIPPDNGYADWNNSGVSYYNSLDRNLESPGGYIGNFPWVADESYYLAVENTTAQTQQVKVNLDGRLFSDDSDVDGLSDGWEYRYFGGLYYDGVGDYDGDRLTNAEEETLGTNPSSRDSDDDKLDDAAEVDAGANPLAADTDLDQVCDGSDSAPTDPNESGPVIRLQMHAWENGAYGYSYGTSQHDTRLVAVFSRDQVKSHWLHVTGYDIDSADEVSVYLNGELLGYLTPGATNAPSMPTFFFVDNDDLLSTGDNRLEFRQKTRGETWGVKDLGLFTFGDSFGFDETRAYDTRHPDGFDIRWPDVEDAFLELRLFDIDSPTEVQVTHENAAAGRVRTDFLTKLPATADLGWSPYYQVPVLSADFGGGLSVLRVRPVGGDGTYQVRLVDCRPITATFGTEGYRGENDHAIKRVDFMFPEKPALRELALQYRVSEGESVRTTSTLKAPFVMPSAGYWGYMPTRFFFSEPASEDRVTVERVISDPAPASVAFVVNVRYYGPCADIDGNGVADCEEVCEDLDEDGYFGRSPLCRDGTDCDDENPEVGAAASDQDCDGVPTDLDCDDSDPEAGSRVDDADCDGVPTDLDCDDNDAYAGPRASDFDCDGVPTETDCDDANAEIGSRLNDADCDTVPSETDCDDGSPNVGAPTYDTSCNGSIGPEDCAIVVGGEGFDGDCDGAPAVDDCDDSDASLGARSLDGDCDRVTKDLDCNDSDASVTTSRLEDGDCDGVPTGLDCDDTSAAITTTNAGDADCDGVPTGLDCNDASAAVTYTTSTDTDCDGSPNGVDCDDLDPLVTGAPDANDRDCDGLPTPIDCDDANRDDLRSRVHDADCDAVTTDVDCNDEDPKDVRLNVGDFDCDGLETDLDCDDRDPNDLRSRANDADCDGSPTAEDCDDNDPTVTVCPVCVDADEDGQSPRTAECPSGKDCDDGDANSTTLDADADCDGVVTDLDCDDADGESLTVAEDADCDAVPSADDCDDANADLGARIDDPDCDGLPSEFDNCPSVNNPEQVDLDVDGLGDDCDDCTGNDSDGDFIVDMCDLCPDVIDDQQDTDDDGTGDACEDGDGDGRYDPVDNCPAVGNPDQLDSDRDGVGDACDTTVVTRTESSSCGGAGATFAGLALVLAWLFLRVRRRSA
jgi:hypothetical protein